MRAMDLMAYHISRDPQGITVWENRVNGWNSWSRWYREKKSPTDAAHRALALLGWKRKEGLSP
jgi:hypothetical protein